MKKGQGISMNVIIIAAIALLVLVVLSVIFLGRIGSFNQKSQDCVTVGGSCDQGITCDPGSTIHPEAVCMDANGDVDSTASCCIRVG